MFATSLLKFALIRRDRHRTHAGAIPRETDLIDSLPRFRRARPGGTTTEQLHSDCQTKKQLSVGLVPAEAATDQLPLGIIKETIL